MTRPLDRSNLQGLVFQSYPCGHSRHFLFQCKDKAGARRFLGEWLPSITHGGIGLDNPTGPLINIAVSWPGLNKLGAFDGIGGVEAAAKAFFFDFKDPPDATSLRAYGASAPENWWNKRFQTGDIDLTVHVYCQSPECLVTTSAKVRSSAQRSTLEELLPTNDGEAITGEALHSGLSGLRTLHFGYRDGFSQPLVNWDDDPAFGRVSDNVQGAYPRGTFIIDDWDDKAQSFPRKQPWRDLVYHGSYLAFAWIHQDVAAFNRFLRDNASKLAPDLPQAEAEEFLAAKMMGRWRDGTPLALSPDSPKPELAGQDFDYSQDVTGICCPVAAHIRIVNGRDRPLSAANRMMFPNGFPRVLRRGSSYGPLLEGCEDDGEDRGIVGMFLCANVNQQFYPLTRWIGTTNFSDDYVDPTGQDPLFASRSVPRASNNFTIPTARGPLILSGIPNFIRIQGVAILLLPSLSTLRQLSV